MGVVAEIERKLARLRDREAGEGGSILRTSTMTHLAWAPPAWLPQARKTLAGLRERHPARTILLVPQPRRATGVSTSVSLHAIDLEGTRDAYAEVVEIRLCGSAVEHPASIVLPLLVSDLPVFCRWRGEPEWGSSQLGELLGIVDRLVVNSSEWRGLPAPYEQLSGLFDRVVVSDIAFSRTIGWRARIAGLWPDVAGVERVTVAGPKADALLLAGWLRSRLARQVALTWRRADEVQAVLLDGRAVEPPPEPAATGSDLLSNELDVFGRDRVYEAAVGAARA
jgi:hypothetical protein